MRPEEREKLRAAASENDYMSIAVNNDDTPVRSVFIPWEATVHAYNMQTPKVTISKDDLQDSGIMKEIRRCKLTGCYIFTPLEDYSFLSSFHDLEDLFILHGDLITDLSFILGKPELFMFYLENAKLKTIGPLVKNCNHGKRDMPKCFGFYHCEIKDTSALKTAKFYISELLIWPGEGQTEHRKRWETGCCTGTLRIYQP